MTAKTWNEVFTRLDAFFDGFSAVADEPDAEQPALDVEIEAEAVDA